MQCQGEKIFPSGVLFKLPDMKLHDSFNETLTLFTCVKLYSKQSYAPNWAPTSYEVRVKLHSYF